MKYRRSRARVRLVRLDVVLEHSREQPGDDGVDALHERSDELVAVHLEHAEAQHAHRLVLDLLCTSRSKRAYCADRTDAQHGVENGVENGLSFSYRRSSCV